MRNRTSEMPSALMEAGIVQDHRQKSSWSEVDYNSTDYVMPIDMTFNDGHRLSIAVYSVLMVVSTIGNATVLKLLIQRRIKSPSRMDLMLIHLALADLLVTLILMPLELGWAYTVQWRAGDLMCRLMAFFRVFGLYLSGFVLVCISIDRYFAVIKPMKIAGIDRRGRTMLMIAWCCSLIFSVPQSFIFHVEHHPNITEYVQCVAFNSFPDEFYHMIYMILAGSLMYGLPLLIILFCYASIYVELFHRSKTCMQERFRRSNDDVLSRAKKKTLWMTITIVIVYVVCWTPFYIMSAWYWLDKESALNVDQRIQKGLFLFACTNSCMNPIVYGLFNIPRKHNRHPVVSMRALSLKSSIIEQRRSSINSTRTNTSVRRSICSRCGESIEKPNLKKHNLYH